MKEIVFTLEWRVEIGEHMTLPLDEVIDKLRESGEANIVDCKVVDEQKGTK